MNALHGLAITCTLAAGIAAQRNEPPAADERRQKPTAVTHSALGANTSGGELNQQQNANQFAIRVRTGATPVLLTGFELFCQTKAAAATLKTEVYLAVDGKPAAEPVRTGEMVVATDPAFYRTEVAPLTVPPNSTFFVTVVPNGRFVHPMLRTGKQAVHYWHEPGTTMWKGPFTTQAWSYRISSHLHGDEQQRRRLALELGALGAAAKSALPALIHALEHDTLPVRREAATALGMIGATASTAIPALTKAAAHEDKQLAARARAALIQLRPRADRHPPERRRVKRLGGDRGTERARDQ